MDTERPLSNCSEQPHSTTIQGLFQIFFRMWCDKKSTQTDKTGVARLHGQKLAYTQYFFVQQNNFPRCILTYLFRTNEIDPRMSEQTNSLSRTCDIACLKSYPVITFQYAIQTTLKDLRSDHPVSTSVQVPGDLLAINAPSD